MPLIRGLRRLRNVNAIPSRIGEATVVCYTPIDDRHRHTGNCRHIVAGALQGPAAGLAICQSDETGGFFLFYCDEDWNVVTDTWHETIEMAKHQAEFEYEGVSNAWIYPVQP